MRNKDYNEQSLIIQELLVNLRSQAQLTQQELSKKLSRPQSYVSKYESGEKKLTLLEIRQIAYCCGTSLRDFVDDLEEEIKLLEGK